MRSGVPLDGNQLSVTSVLVLRSMRNLFTETANIAFAFMEMLLLLPFAFVPNGILYSCSLKNDQQYTEMCKMVCLVGVWRG